MKPGKPVAKLLCVLFLSEAEDSHPLAIAVERVTAQAERQALAETVHNIVTSADRCLSR